MSTTTYEKWFSFSYVCNVYQEILQGYKFSAELKADHIAAPIIFDFSFVGFEYFF